MLLQLSTWPEVEAYLTSSPGIIFPIGSTEQHGPTGLIGTDAICAEAVARGVGEATGALVGPTINVGMALHHSGVSRQHQSAPQYADCADPGLYKAAGSARIRAVLLYQRAWR